MRAAVSTLRDLEAAFLAGAPDHAREWLLGARERVVQDRRSLETLFPAAARACGRAPLVEGWRTDDAARVLMLALVPWSSPEPLISLYRHGDAEERRAILLALDRVVRDGRALPVVEDALRSNDSRLISAALGPYGARHLPTSAYRQAILKCVFCGIPLAAVSGLDDRVDDGLARMLADFVQERTVAGRTVPDDVWRVLSRFPSYRSR